MTTDSTRPANVGSSRLLVIVCEAWAETLSSTTSLASGGTAPGKRATTSSELPFSISVSPGVTWTSDALAAEATGFPSRPESEPARPASTIETTTSPHRAARWASLAPWMAFGGTVPPQS